MEKNLQEYNAKAKEIKSVLSVKSEEEFNMNALVEHLKLQQKMFLAIAANVAEVSSKRNERK